MRIEYNKTITDQGELRPFFSREEPKWWFSKYLLDGKVALINYDLKSLENALTDGLEKNLKLNGFTAKRSANNQIWVAEPNKFSLSLDANKTYEYLPVDKCIQKYTEQGGRFFKREIPIYEEMPSVDISGKICYEYLEEIDPTPVLNVLNTLKYQSKVIPTSEEIREFFKNLKKKRSCVRIRKDNQSEEKAPMSLGDYLELISETNYL